MTPTDDTTSPHAPSSPGLALSVVLPVFNERDNLEPLLARLTAVLQSLQPAAAEIIVVDDGSTDGGSAVLRQCAVGRPDIKPLFHHRNFGQSAALATGFAQAAGELVATLDADLQNAPEDIPALLAALTEEIDAVIGVRTQRADNGLRRVSARVANAVRNVITRDRLRDSGCGLRLIRRRALAEIPVFNGMHRFLPSLLRLQGYRVVEQPVGHHPRLRGRSKYNVRNRLVRGLVDCLVMRWWRRRMLPARRTTQGPRP